MTPEAATWKGLDTSRMPVFLGYDQIERMIAALLDRASAWQPDAVVGLARGGVVPAAMAAGILALPLHFVGHDKATGSIDWIGPPAPGRRVLLVDDCCSSGRTLHRAREAIRAEGRECLTLVVVHDPDTIRHMPDLSHPTPALFRLPWERGEATPTGRAAKASGGNLDPRVEAPFVGVGLDGALLSAVAEGSPRSAAADGSPRSAAADGTLLSVVADGTPMPRISFDRAVLISGQPRAEQARIEARIAETPWRLVPLECRPDGSPDDPISVAHFKAEAATRWGCTHFIESDAAQAIALSGHARHLIVTWWSSAAARGWTIGAAEQPDPGPPFGGGAAS